MSDMTSPRPYLIRAIHEWLVDNSHTPCITVNALDSGVVVPKQRVQDGVIVLDISPDSTNNLMLGDEAITCQASFGGVIHDLFVPVDAVLAIFSEENQQGLLLEQFDYLAVAEDLADLDEEDDEFDDEEDDYDLTDLDVEEDDQEDDLDCSEKSSSSLKLKIIKGGKR